MSAAPPSLDPLATLPPLVDRAAAHALRRAIEAAALQRGVVLRAFPPEPTGCCGRGCNGCVWSGYYEAVAYWRDEALLQLQD